MVSLHSTLAQLGNFKGPKIDHFSLKRVDRLWDLLRNGQQQRQHIRAKLGKRLAQPRRALKESVKKGGVAAKCSQVFLVNHLGGYTTELPHTDYNFQHNDAAQTVWPHWLVHRQYP